jgi:cystathionine beta-lyase family protein involved in aluminum resistance
MEPKNDMFVSIRKGRPDFIRDSIPNPLPMVIVKNDYGHWIRRRLPCEDGADFVLHPVNVSTAKEGG